RHYSKKLPYGGFFSACRNYQARTGREAASGFTNFVPDKVRLYSINGGWALIEPVLRCYSTKPLFNVANIQRSRYAVCQNGWWDSCAVQKSCKQPQQLGERVHRHEALSPDCSLSFYRLRANFFHPQLAARFMGGRFASLQGFVSLGVKQFCRVSRHCE
ncbi:hypothetical protein, partial [Pseudomaricurvus alcaniphilus]|uniref:hypothetical protein n=1 Tax=Pseudomaricurvus alcaniphilus TaxID=1166482 RepID=UPI001A9E82C1